MDFLNLVAYLKMDKSDYDKGLKDSESLAYKTGQGIGTILNKTAKVAAAGIAATTTAVAGLVAASVKGYAEYEQLVGGVETLFDNTENLERLKRTMESTGYTAEQIAEAVKNADDPIQTVMNNAANAYKTAGLSASEYMETVTGMAAALNQSTGDLQVSAEMADMAITDMADNANKMGSSMESIQNAYAGFAKQNYTMLDNLKLGYGGTKEEMARLLEDAEKISGKKFDLKNYADIVDAIHIIQTEMGITGTTAKEATETISGSLAMVGSAWKNLVTGITNPDADISKLIDDMVFSVKAAANNLVPAVSQALKGVVSVVKELAPVIAEELPSLLNDILPMLIDAGISLFQGLVDALPTILQVLFEQLPTIIQAVIDAVLTFLPMIIDLGFTFLEALMEGILDALPQVMEAVGKFMKKLAELFSDPARLKDFLNTAVEIIMTLADGLIKALPEMIPAIIDVILGIVEMLTEPDRLIMLIEAAIEIILAIAQGLIEAIPRLIEAIPVIISNIVSALLMAIPTIAEGAWELFGGLLMGLLKAVPELLAQIPILIVSILEGLAKGIKQLMKMGVKLVEAIKDGIASLDPVQWGKDLIQKFIDGLLEKWNSLKETVKDIASSIADFLGFSEPKLGPLSNFHTYAPDMMELFAKGVEDNKQMLLDTVSDAFDFGDMIVGPVGETQSTTNTSSISELITLLKQLVNSDRNVTVVLEGDADRLFRVIQKESIRNNQLTGQPSFS